MSEMKYRGRIKDSKRWVEGCYCKSPISDENSGMPPSTGWYFLTGEERHLIIKEGVAFTVDPETVSCGPGRKDCKDNDLFVGDIVQSTFTKSVGILRYGEYRDEDALDLDQDFYVDNDKVNRKSFGFFVQFKDSQAAIDNMTEKWLEKIGNIYDNPDWIEVPND